MRTPKELPEGALESLAKELKQAKTKAQFQSVQCLWLRASLGLTADQVATAIGWHPNSVRKLQARYFKEGEAALKRGGRGGRYFQNLTIEEERRLLQEFLAQSETGGILEVSRVKAAYEQALGRKVPKSTVYRMLARHGWRKVLPRPRHPKSDAATQAAFKKTGGNS
ncbi:MAG: winged helix-turn-helix domain-containing protein [Syntrophobacterales bacterium]|jgi:transposase|nr:winged helix-turn-helix domain-containing protein [Syntrophobacterales bacterium]